MSQGKGIIKERTKDEPPEASTFSPVRLRVILVISYIAISTLALIALPADSLLERIAQPVSLLGVFLAIYIAFVQHAQLKDIEKIASRTEITARKIRSDDILQEFVGKFYVLPQDPPRKYVCVFPVLFESKPLPLINAGDYYALQVLVNHLGEDNVKLHGITSEKEDHDGSILAGNVVFLCSPQTNPLLHSIFPPTNINEEQSNIRDLPCWFADKKSELKDGVVNKTITQKILWVAYDGTTAPIVSPADDLYRQAALLNRGEPYPRFYEPKGNAVEDYAIIARISEGEYHHIIVAGIHQFGTWIAAGFLDRLSRGVQVDYHEIFLGDGDFLAVIWGEFDMASLQVTYVGVHQKHLWQLQNQRWVRVDF